jgi:ribokinase
VVALAPQVVIGQFEIPQATTAAAFAAGRGVGATTILNPAPGAAVDPQLLGVSDWLVPNETEFALVTGDRLTGIADADAEAVTIASTAERLDCSLVVTLGERGAIVAPRGEPVVRVETPRVTAIDTTGAGDAFVGAFAVGLALGLAAVDAARLGCAAAADSVTRLGTQTSYPDRTGAAAILAAYRG